MTIDKAKLKALAETGAANGNWLECPATDVLALLAEIERLEAQVHLAGVSAELTVHQEVGRSVTDMLVVMAERDQLKSENEALRRRCERLESDKQAMTETHVLYTWLRKKVYQSSNDQVAVTMSIGHDWVIVHDLDRDLRSMIDREEP